jgi:hypothetical protein
MRLKSWLGGVVKPTDRGTPVLNSWSVDPRPKVLAHSIDLGTCIVLGVTAGLAGAQTVPLSLQVSPVLGFFAKRTT